VLPTRVIISREGAMGLLTQGHKGRKEIDLSQITALQFKHADPPTVGYIQFSFMGGSETKMGLTSAVRDENSILFKKAAEPQFVRAKALIDVYRERLRHGSPARHDPIGDIERLAKLRDQGLVTNEEFEAKKRQLLGL
jgi:hypothetical protein